MGRPQQGQMVSSRLRDPKWLPQASVVPRGVPSSRGHARRGGSSAWPCHPLGLAEEGPSKKSDRRFRHHKKSTARRARVDATEL